MVSDKKPFKRVSELRVDLDTATREELVAEVKRLDDVVNRWAEGWHTIVEANTLAWIDAVNSRDARIKMLENLINER